MRTNVTIETPDVLVVGLGPAGSRAAEAAARAGLRVIALEKRGEPGSPVQCAEFVPLDDRARRPECRRGDRADRRAHAHLHR